jgi:hypothetical protein
MKDMEEVEAAHFVTEGKLFFRWRASDHGSQVTDVFIDHDGQSSYCVNRCISGWLCDEWEPGRFGKEGYATMLPLLSKGGR